MVQIAVPISSLRDLPIGAGYERHHGRASARLVRTARDSVLLWAHCDSLQVLVDELLIQRDRLEGFNAQLLSRLETEADKTSTPAQPPWHLSWTVVIVLVLVIALWRLWQYFRL